MLDGRQSNTHRRAKHNFAFSGLILCKQCGCAVVGEIKKQRYIYYHCTGYADKCQGNPASCRRNYVREEALEAQFTELLGRLKFDDEVLDWVARDAETALHPSCTCAMGSVVDPATMRVYGLDGIRVVDASVFPSVPNGNIYAPVMMVAEKAADLILGATPLPPEPVPFYRHGS